MFTEEGGSHENSFRQLNLVIRHVSREDKFIRRLRVLQGNVGNNLQTERQYNCREHLSLFRLQ